MRSDYRVFGPDPDPRLSAFISDKIEPFCGGLPGFPVLEWESAGEIPSVAKDLSFLRASVSLWQVFRLW